MVNWYWLPVLFVGYVLLYRSVLYFILKWLERRSRLDNLLKPVNLLDYKFDDAVSFFPGKRFPPSEYPEDWRDVHGSGTPLYDEMQEALKPTGTQPGGVSFVPLDERVNKKQRKTLREAVKRK